MILWKLVLAFLNRFFFRRLNQENWGKDELPKSPRGVDDDNKTGRREIVCDCNRKPIFEGETFLLKYHLQKKLFFIVSK
jgi:hypothetical protein